jgi:DNA-binding transcriptional regulator YdaS (Cro superfamily)
MLLSLLKLTDMTVAQLAAELSTTPENICRWMTGSPETPIEKVKQIKRLYSGGLMREILTTKYGTQAAAAEALGISAAFLSQIANNRRNPGPGLAYKIEVETLGAVKAHALLSYNR